MCNAEQLPYYCDLVTRCMSGKHIGAVQGSEAPAAESVVVFVSPCGVKTSDSKKLVGAGDGVSRCVSLVSMWMRM